MHVGDTALLVETLNEHQAAEDGLPLPLDMATWAVQAVSR